MCPLGSVFLSVHYFLLLILAEFLKHSSYWLLHKPFSPPQPFGVPGLFQRSLRSLQGHRHAAAPAGRCVGHCQTAGAGRGCSCPPSPPQLGNPYVPAPFTLVWEDCLCLTDKKIKMDQTELKAGEIEEFAQGLHLVTGKARAGLCPCSPPSTQTPAQPSLSQMQLTQSRLGVIYCSLGVFSNCIFFSCQELTATA